MEAAVLRKLFGREVKNERHRFRIIKECVYLERKELIDKKSIERRSEGSGRI